MRPHALCYFSILMLMMSSGGCGPSPVKTMTLPSSKTIVVTSVVPMAYPNGDNVLTLNCETDISVDDHVALRKEVDEIWTIFQPDVERAKFDMAAIRISEHRASGLLTVSKGYGFVFKKQTDGRWKCLNDEKSQTRR
jgi:hypothetical protein